MIDVGLNATNGKLLDFLYSPGPGAALDASGAISQQDAIRIAKDRVGSSFQTPTTTASAGIPTTTVSPGVVVKSAELVHTDAPGITGGKDLLVWIVTLGGTNPGGVVSATIYIDALTGKVLTELSGS